MEIILQDSGHVSLFLVGGNSSPVLTEHFGALSPETAKHNEIGWDVISFRPPGFSFDRWAAREVPKPSPFIRRSNIQTSKIQANEAEALDVWAQGRSMAAYVSFMLPSHRPTQGASILNDFNCCSGVIACLHAMGLSLDGLKGDAGTQYDFSQIALDF